MSLPQGFSRIDDAVLTTTSTPEVIYDGLGALNTGAMCTTTDAPVFFPNGIPTNATGSVCVTTSATLPTFVSNGMLFDATGRLVVTSSPVSPLFSNAGLVFDSTGALSVSGSGAPATLVIVAGQSNNLGWSQDPLNTTAMTGGRGYEYRDSGATGAWMPIGITLVGRTQGGPHAAFANAWTNGGGGVCLFVNVAVNGSSMIDSSKVAQTGNAATEGYESLGGGTWDLTGGANSLYAQANGAKVQIDKAIAAAAAAGFAISKKIVTWVQGEQDAQANASTANYTPRLVALIDRFVADYAIDAFLISALGVASASPPAAWANIRTGQYDAVALRPLISTMAFTDAPNFFAAGKNIATDTLHYTQTGYNEMGAGLATNGLTFIGGLSLPAPPATIYANILANPPALDRYKRMVMTTTRSGAISPQIYSGLNTPNSFTFFDGSGVNRMQGGNPSTWSYPSTVAKPLCLYISDFASAPTFVGGGNLTCTAITVPDVGFKCGAFNFGAGGDEANGMTFPEADILRMDATALSFFAVGGPAFTAFAFTDAVLNRFTNLTYVNLQRSDTLASVNWGIRPAITTIGLQRIGYTTAEVNQILQTVDAMGTSGPKTLELAQFLSSPAIPSAPPSGAGLVAKANLISRGWTVNTD